MGDRGNIAVVDTYGTNSAVFLYTHWGGGEIAIDLAKALSRQARWDDGPYLTRIIFDAMVGDEHGQESGHGISTGLTDNEHPVLVVDVRHQRVVIVPEDAATNAARLAEILHVNELDPGWVVVPFEEHDRLPEAFEEAHQ
jgi:hypothetical protein